MNRNSIAMTEPQAIQHPRLKFVDHAETFGRHVLADLCIPINCQVTLDIGCGHGADLMIVKAQHPSTQCYGVEFSDWNHQPLTQLGIKPLSLNIENQALPLENESVDFVIANQVFEHTKEIFWINHEIFRTLKVGGHMYLGVPNTLAWHNRILALLGRHPTCVQSASAHVRAFSKRDTVNFYNQIIPNSCLITAFRGAQFYPFPKKIARPLANGFPSLAVTIFFLIKKTRAYENEFIDWVDTQRLETNFFTGQAVSVL
jgi:SAM-dependent methyltransferase